MYVHNPILSLTVVDTNIDSFTAFLVDWIDPPVAVLVLSGASTDDVNDGSSITTMVLMAVESLCLRA
jgi:hypothetical protein